MSASIPSAASVMYETQPMIQSLVDAANTSAGTLIGVQMFSCDQGLEEDTGHIRKFAAMTSRDSQLLIKLVGQRITKKLHKLEDSYWVPTNTHKYRGASKSLARPGRKQATATEDFIVHISYLS